MSEGDRGDPAQWDEARRWFAIAEQDLRVALLCLAAQPPASDAAAYHCQQSAEKLIKGLMVAAAVPFRRVHDLDELADQAVRHFPNLASYLNFCRPLSRWGTVFRYPTLGDAAEVGPSVEEIGEAIGQLSEFRRAIHAHEAAVGITERGQR
jgi:HEPN domain-containing protein